MGFEYRIKNIDKIYEKFLFFVNTKKILFKKIKIIKSAEIYVIIKDVLKSNRHPIDIKKFEVKKKLYWLTPARFVSVLGELNIKPL